MQCKAQDFSLPQSAHADSSLVRWSQKVQCIRFCAVQRTGITGRPSISPSCPKRLRLYITLTRRTLSILRMLSAMSSPMLAPRSTIVYAYSPRGLFIMCSTFMFRSLM